MVSFCMLRNGNHFKIDFFPKFFSQPCPLITFKCHHARFTRNVSSLKNKDLSIEPFFAFNERNGTRIITVVRSSKWMSTFEFSQTFQPCIMRQTTFTAYIHKKKYCTFESRQTRIIYEAWAFIRMENML